jgi:hypothetical protein
MDENLSKQKLDSKIELEIISKEKKTSKKALFNRQSVFNYLKVVMVIILGSGMGVGFMFLIAYIFNF